MNLRFPVKYLLIIGNNNSDNSFLIDFFKGLLGQNLFVEDNNTELLIVHNYLDTLNIREAIDSLNSDLLMEIKVFSSRVINSSKELLRNLEIIRQTMQDMTSELRYFEEKILTKEALNVSSPLVLKELALGKYHNDNEMLYILKMLFKCNLNVSKAASELYMHRNTIINKLDRFIEYTGYNVKEFNDALVIYNLINK